MEPERFSATHPWHDGPLDVLEDVVPGLAFLRGLGREHLAQIARLNLDPRRNVQSVQNMHGPCGSARVPFAWSSCCSESHLH